jgi:hypothetical protein
MYPEQWEVVDDVDAYHNFRSTSTALRYIIEEYRRLKRRDNGQQSDEDEPVPAQ